MQRAFVIAGEIVGEAEVIPDVGVEGRDRDAESIRKTVGLDLVVGALDERGGVFEVGKGLLELTGRDETVATVAVEAGILGVEFDAVGVDANGIPVAAEVGGSAAIPDDGLDIGR